VKDRVMPQSYSLYDEAGMDSPVGGITKQHENFMAPPLKLDPLEQHFFISSPIDGLKLFLRLLPARVAAPGKSKVVLYIHGGTFPSALSIAHRFDGRSWRDELVAAGFHVWGLDFQGYGSSDPYPEMRQSAEYKPALGQAKSASEQLEQAARFICEHHRVPKISIIAHSWGTIATGLLAGRCPELIERLVFFAPITWRQKQAEPQIYPAWRLVSLQEQWDRFTQDVPPAEPAVLNRQDFAEWGELYLETDAESQARSPAAVKTPSGPWQDIALAWAGQLAYDPTNIQASVGIIRGEWDKASTEADVHWLFNALKNSPLRREVKISRATHLMHLEESRFALYREAGTFLDGNDLPGKLPSHSLRNEPKEETCSP
jgi:pimeloyl-ACP methyl ester carboxylesterase